MDTASPVIPQLQSPGVAHQWPGNPGSAHRRHPHELVHAVRLRAPGRRRGDAADHGGPGPADRGARLPALVPVRRSGATALAAGARRAAPSRWRSGGSVQLDARVGARRRPRRRATSTRSRARAPAGPARGLLGDVRPAPDPAVVLRARAGSTLPPDGPEQYTVTLRLRVARPQRPQGGGPPHDRRASRPDAAARIPQDGGRRDGRRAELRSISRAATSSTSSSPPTTGRSTRCAPTAASCRVSRCRSDGERQIDPANPQNYPRARLPRPDVARRARAAHRGRGRRPAPRRAAGDRGDQRQRRRVRLGRARPPPARVPRSTPTRATGRCRCRRRRRRPNHSRLPARGNWSPPVLADLEGNGRLDILMTAFDGFVYAFRPDGTAGAGMAG